MISRPDKHRREGYLEHFAVCYLLLPGNMGAGDLHILHHHLLLVPPLGGGEPRFAARTWAEEQIFAEGGDEIVVQAGFLQNCGGLMRNHPCRSGIKAVA